ncbi:MAG: YdcF family protein [Moraxellaceae bacterium]|nr:MAG: YdcF family protein [Moraxellaceae bacterium]
MAEALAQLQDDYQQQNAQLNREKTGLDQDSAHVIVVLGGGLGRDSARNIVVNAYTKMRLERAVEQKKHNPLPILLSGVEAPYMQKWLKQHGVDALLLEDRSMNTCENTRFSSLLLQKKGGAPKVELITDAYHMPRARRLFAINGIDTVPVDAPLPIAPTEWQPSKTNLMHSRRATYEAIATMRDIWFGETNCREVP